MNKLRIVIVTYNWPPRNSISTHRPYSWARYWSQKGAKITILTAEKQMFDEPLDMPLPELEGVEVVQVPYVDLFSLLPNTFLKFPFILNIAKKIKLWQIRNFGSSWDPRKVWSKAAASIAARLASENDIVVSTFGPSSAHFIACEMKKINPSIYWVADYRDLWSDSPNLVGARLVTKKKILKDELSTVGDYADCITVVSDDMVKKLQTLTKKKVIKFTNGFDIDLNFVEKKFKQKIIKINETFRIVYTGTIYQNLRDPIPLLEALVNLVENKKILTKSITVDFYGARLEYIEKLSQNPRYSTFIRIMGHVSREQALKAQQKADLLLLLESSQEESRGVLTGKIFEYIAAGRPIICIGSRSDFEIGQTLSKTGVGTVFEKHEQAKIEKLIIETIQGEGLFANYHPNFDEVKKFSREQIANKYLNLLEDIVSKKLLISSLNPILKRSVNTESLPAVTHIITGLERGGAERSLYNLLTNGLEGPIKNRVISLMSEGYYGPLLKKAGIPLTCLNMSRGKINPKALWKLRLALLKDKPDILQGWMYHGNLAATLGSILCSKPVKLGWNIRLSLEIFSDSGIKTKAAIKLGAWLSSWAQSIIYNSKRSLSQHRKIGFANRYDHFIPNGFITNQWAPNETIRKKVRDELSIPENNRVIGYIGRGDEQKDLPNLFKAFDKVSQKYPDTILIAIGLNLDKYKFQSKSVKFLGQRSNIHELILSFDILCLSSRAEGFPNVIGEAMSSGLPCVTTDVGDASDIVGDTGWVAKPRDSNQLANCLDAALTCTPHELKNLGNQARKRIIDNFSMTLVKERYISLYQSLEK